MNTSETWKILSALLTNKIFKNRYYFIPLSLCWLFYYNKNNFACNYKHISKDEIWTELVRKVSKNTTFRNGGVCDYVSLLSDQSVMTANNLNDVVLDTSHIKSGGEYVPQDCKPLFSTAIIVPYRDRDKHLKDFLTHMHMFLRKQNIHYRIYVVEQEDSRPFNRAKLLNIGSMIAIKHGFPCIILHDVDLLPMIAGNIYACTVTPRHMSTSIDLYRFNLPYEQLIGGVTSLLSEQFMEVNGMSNSYYGWGGEDDDFFQRLMEINLTPIRFPPSISAYVMLKHNKAVPSDERKKLLNRAPLRFATDGLNSLKYVEKATKLHPLFTHIIVQL